MKKIHKWLITGDMHGQLERVEDIVNYLKLNNYKPKETAIIFLGDCGFNYYGQTDRRDLYLKEKANNIGCIFYCLRGNHEFRPSHLVKAEKVYDSNVQGLVYIEPQFPNIHYLLDWGEYVMNNLFVLAIGGAYSVDKNYRLSNGWKWFEDEQLDEIERQECFKTCKGKYFNLVLSHTCPYSNRPIDLFLPMVDQSIVDNTMEYFLEDIKSNIDYDMWLWGHYHADRPEGDKERLVFKDFIKI